MLEHDFAWRAGKMNIPKVLIIVLTYNGIALTMACLDSLRRITWPAYEVLVVDSGSTDSTVDIVRANYSEVEVMPNNRNIGFAEGNNRGLEHAVAHGFDYALLLNNDTEVAADFLTHLVGACETDKTLGAVGPLIYYHSQPQQIWSAGGIVERATGRTFMRGLNELDQSQFAEGGQVDFVTGCALLVRCSILSQVGLLDERFGMYFEETEWCARMRRSGWGIAFVPQSHVWHKILPDLQALSPRVTYYMTRNRLLYLRLTHAPIRAWAHVMLLQDWRTWLSWSVRPRWRDRAEARKSIPRAWRDFILGRFGMVAQ